MTELRPPPARQRVTRPQAAARHAGVELRREIDEQTILGEALMRSLVRAQLRLAATVIGTIAATLGLLPLLFAVLPGVARADIAGVPLSWLLLGVVVYPVLVAVGSYYVRVAERNEREFAELADRP